jgi:hypothetical protein
VGATIIGFLVFSSLTWVIYRTRVRSTIQRRKLFINDYKFPQSIYRKVKDKYPHLTAENLVLVDSGLRVYFQVCNLAGNRFVSMPSQVVDAAWHEFILFTREYQEFCNKALGRFLHHTPAEAMTTPTKAQNGIKRAWRLSCMRERIDAKRASRLPILFAIDTDLKIPDGFKYSLNYAPGTGGYSASHIGCGGGCGGAHSCGGDGGGGGCGGGCGGGS